MHLPQTVSNCPLFGCCVWYLPFLVYKLSVKIDSVWFGFGAADRLSCLGFQVCSFSLVSTLAAVIFGGRVRSRLRSISFLAGMKRVSLSLWLSNVIWMQLGCWFAKKSCIIITPEWGWTSRNCGTKPSPESQGSTYLLLVLRNGTEKNFEIKRGTRNETEHKGQN